MSEAEKVFRQTSKERKLSGATHRVSGAKSKKCKLPSDGMTRKEWEKMNGECKTFALNAPTTYAILRLQDMDIQKTYVNRMIEMYGVSMRRFCTMLHTTPSTFSSELADLFPRTDHPHDGVNKEKTNAWNEFLTKFNWDAGYYKAHIQPKPADSKPSRAEAFNKRYNVNTEQASKPPVPVVDPIGCAKKIITIIVHTADEMAAAIKSAAEASVEIKIEAQF